MIKKLEELNKNWLDEQNKLLDIHDRVNRKLNEMGKITIDYELQVNANKELKNKEQREAVLRQMKNDDEHIRIIRDDLDKLNYAKKETENKITFLDTEMKNIRAYLRSKESD